MARTFDHSTSNYMSRGSTNLGLNGLTACSFAFWIRITNVDASTEQRVLAKEINGLDAWNSILCVINTNTTKPKAFVQNNSTGDYPEWLIDTGIGTGTWARCLFTWERTAGAASTDAQWYVNGAAVTSTHTVNGYTNTFTIQENSSNLYYGIRPITLTGPLDADLAWVCIWNRKLSVQEAMWDYMNPRLITSGLLQRVRLGNDNDGSGSGFHMTVNGTLAQVADPAAVNSETVMFNR